MALCTVLSKAVLCEAQCETILYNHSGYRSRLQIITVSYENLGIVICSSVSSVKIEYSPIPRPLLPPVFDHFQYANVKRDLVKCSDVRRIRR